jgi:pimeloyl-ACP methyl ester carboxylesterase
MSAGSPRLGFDRSGSGEPLLLIHGLGVTRRCWDPIVPALESRHEVLRHDLPGFGESAPLPDGVPCSADGFADALERELDALGIGQPHVVGHSMGGWIALELAARGRARTVTALASVGGWTRAEALYVSAATSYLRLGAKALRPLAGPMTSKAPLRRMLLWLTNSRGERVPPQRAAEAIRAMADAESFRAARNWFIRRTPAGLERISCPALIAWGTKDRLLFPRQGPRLVAMIPGARLVELRRLGHDLMNDDPERTVQAILEGTGSGAPTAVGVSVK